MVTTRSKDIPSDHESSSAGTKRKEHAISPQPEHEPKAAKKQITIDEALQFGNDANNRTDSQNREHAEAEERDRERTKNLSAKSHEEQEDKAMEGRSEEEDRASKDAIVDSAEREENLPTNVLEKGIIYFFTRNRVGIDEANNVNDLQRTFFVLRPLNPGAKLGEGAVPDSENNRLFALPKKMFPKSHSDRFMAFVEKSKVSIQELKDQFFKGTEYQTKTSGARHVDPVTPVGEGVYIITRTEDRTTHMVYAMTIPTELGEVQNDLGLRPQGSFIISVKNPERPGPASAQLPQGPGFPKEILNEFRGLAWAEVKPKYLDYENCQILLIGEDVEKAIEPTEKDKKHGKKAPIDEIQQLEHEDELRVEHLRGNDSVFDDLEISKKEYPKVPTTW